MEEIRPNAAQGRPDLSFFAYSQDVSSVGRAAATSTSEDPVVILSDTDEVEAMVVSANNHTTTTEGQTMTTVTVPASESAPDVHTDDATAPMDTYETSGIARATPTVQADTESPTTQPQQLSPAPSNTKRQDDPSSLEDFRSPKRRREEPVDDDRSEYQTCPICFEPWANSGRHRIGALKCGHLFGKSCIEKWLKGQGGRCPQCNAKAKKSDIRLIYAKAIETVDTTEKEAVMRELEKERIERKRAQQSEAKLMLKYQLLKAELERERTQTVELAAKCDEDDTAHDARANAMFELEHVCDLPQGNNRILSHDVANGVLIASAEATASTIFYPKGHGILKMSMLATRHTQYVGLHKKPIKGLAPSPDGQGLLLSASLDKTVKISSLETNSVVQSYQVNRDAWSCAWNAQDPTYFYVGLSNASILVYDIRNTNECVETVETGPSSPLVSLHFVSEHDGFGCNGLLAGTLSGVRFWRQVEDTQDFVDHALGPLQGPCTWTTLCPQTHQLVASFRPTKQVPKTRHALCKLDLEMHNSSPVVDCSVTGQFLGGVSCKLLSRPQLFLPPNRTSPLLAAADEASKTVNIWDTDSTEVIQTLHTSNQPCLDLQWVNRGDDGNHLAALVDKKLLLYKWYPQ